MSKLKYILIISLFISLLGCDKYEVTSEQEGTFVKMFGTRNSDVGIDVKVFNDGYIILATVNTPTKEKTEIVLYQTNRFGNIKQVDTLSTIREGDNTASKLLLTADGGFIVLGTVTDTVNNSTDIYLNKFSASITSDWEKTIGTVDNEKAASIKIISDGFIIAGSTDAQDIGNSNPKGKLDIYLVKTDEQGNVIWTENHGGSGDDYANEIILIDEGYLIVGTTNGFDGPGQANNNIILVKTNFTGGSPDMETYGGSKNDFGTSLVKSNDGGYVILGNVEDVTGSNSDVYILKIESDIHTITWDRVYGIANLNDLGYDIVKSNEGYIISGSKELASGDAAYFLKIDSNGEEIVENTYGGFGQIIYAIEPTPDGGYVMTGTSGIEGNEMISLIKVNSEGEL